MSHTASLVHRYCGPEHSMAAAPLHTARSGPRTGHRKGRSTGDTCGNNSSNSVSSSNNSNDDNSNNNNQQPTKRIFSRCERRTAAHDDSCGRPDGTARVLRTHTSSQCQSHAWAQARRHTPTTLRAESAQSTTKIKRGEASSDNGIKSGDMPTAYKTDQPMQCHCHARPHAA
jgi:hypothetical protein